MLLVLVMFSAIYRIVTQSQEWDKPIPIAPKIIEGLKKKPLEPVYSDVITIDDDERLVLNSINTTKQPVIVPHVYLPPPNKDEELIICRTYNGQDCLPTHRNGRTFHYREMVERLGYRYINNRVILIDPQKNSVNITYLLLYVSKMYIKRPNSYEHIIELNPRRIETDEFIGTPADRKNKLRNELNQLNHKEKTDE